MLRRIQPQVTDHLAAVGEPADLSQGERVSQSRNRFYPRISPEQLRHSVFLASFDHRLLQLVYSLIQIIRRVSSSSRLWAVNRGFGFQFSTFGNFGNPGNLLTASYEIPHQHQLE